MDREETLMARLRVVNWVANFLDSDDDTNAEIDIGTHVFRIAALPGDYGEWVYRLLGRKADQEEVKWTTVIAGRPHRAEVEAWIEKQRLAAAEYIAAQIPREIPEAYGSW